MSELISLRIKPELRKESDLIFKELGINRTEAFNMFLSQVVLKRGLPFDVKIPKKKVLDSVKDLKENKGLKKYTGEDYLKLLKAEADNQKC